MAAFPAGEGRTYVVAGVVRGWKPKQYAWDACYLATYVLDGSKNGTLSLLHKASRSPLGLACAFFPPVWWCGGACAGLAKPWGGLQTPIEGGVPCAMATFHNRLLVGVGKFLRLYDLGKKKLLRKCENKVR
jgi:splicing factor 3B subunit 3